MNVRFSATGDALITRRACDWQSAGFKRLLDVLASTSARFTNVETLFPNGLGYAAADWGGTFVCSPPGCLDDLVGMGFNLFSRANNHAGDWAGEGLLETTRVFEARGVCHAGAGKNLAEARSPGYLDLAGGKIALLAVATSAPNATYPAGAQRPDCRGRPGVSALRFSEYTIVPPATLELVKEIAGKTRHEPDKRYHVDLGFRPKDPEGVFVFGDIKFKVGDDFDEGWECHRGDFEDIMRYVRDARRQADYVLVSFHGHELPGKDHDGVPSFHQDFCRACIDAGSDAVMGHGPHRLRGIEVYKGKPIFYSLGNFIFQNEEPVVQPADFYERVGVDPLLSTPAEAFDRRNSRGKGGFLADSGYWESVIACWDMQDGVVRDVRLYPIDLGFGGTTRSQRGRPMLAERELGQKIIGKLNRLSQPLGTRVVWNEDGYGTVETNRTEG